jgi:hypothetical protein
MLVRSDKQNSIRARPDSGCPHMGITAIERILLAGGLFGGGGSGGFGVRSGGRFVAG